MAEAKYITRVEILLTEDEKSALYDFLVDKGNYPDSLDSLVEVLGEI